MPYRKKNTGNWYITWSESGKQRTRSSKTSDFKEAKRLENKLRAKESKPISAYSIDTVLSEYLIARSTVRAGYAVEKLVAAWTGIDIHNITPEMIARYKANRGVSDSSLKRELGVLRAAIRYCNQELDWNLPNILEGRMPKEPKGRIRWLTLEESKSLIDEAKGYLKEFIIIGLNTGLRKGEILSLTWDRVDLVRNEIRFTPSDHKSGTYATVPINQTAVDSFLRLRGDDVLVIYRNTKDGRKPIEDIKKGFKAACGRSGIKNFTPHDLRHTCASWMVQAGVPIASVKEVLRHQDISTTMRYAHLAPENARDAVNAITAVVSAVPKCKVVA